MEKIDKKYRCPLSIQMGYGLYKSVHQPHSCSPQINSKSNSLQTESWHQQRNEITELCQRIEAQNNLIAEQSHRLTNADLLVKDLYVENSQLSAALQRLEQQRNRNSLILQHGIPGIPGMP